MYKVSAPSMYLPPENPVLDITGCRREEARFFGEAGYLPEVMLAFSREVDMDNLWGVRAVVVYSRWPVENGGWREVSDVGGG
jgi:hypothetical protein